MDDNGIMGPIDDAGIDGSRRNVSQTGDQDALRHSSQPPLALTSSRTATDEGPDQESAKKIQRAWRAHRSIAASTSEAQTNWEEVDMHIQDQLNRKAAEESQNDPHSRWTRAAFMASRLRDGDAIRDVEKEYKVGGLPPEDVERLKLKTKVLETQHWLELIDGKHRYGSNLKFYFRRWVEANTDQNFFYWLDRGDGKDLDLPECSREDLESEKITYLSPQQRKNYLVNIDQEGRLRWARNGELVDTTANKWKDSEGYMGIVPLDGTEDKAVEKKLRRQASTLSGHAYLGSDDDDEEEEEVDYKQQGEHYTGDPRQGKVSKVLAETFTAKGITDRLLRQSVRKNTWIYLADAKLNIFIGIKNTGAFQHSSFTGGGLITSAGLIKVKDGQIKSMSPLSGHYRTSVDHFRAFVNVLEQRGADLNKVQRTKAEVALWGLSNWKKTKKAKSEFVHKRKKELKAIVSGPTKKQEERKDDSTDASPSSPEIREVGDRSNGDIQSSGSTTSSESESESEPQTEEDQVADGNESDHKWVPQHDGWRKEVLNGRGRSQRYPDKHKRESRRDPPVTHR